MKRKILLLNKWINCANYKKEQREAEAKLQAEKEEREAKLQAEKEKREAKLKMEAMRTQLELAKIQAQASQQSGHKPYIRRHKIGP